MVQAFSFSLLLLLILGTCPQRQALLDWVKYQSQSWQSWIWGAKSPVLLAMTIQMLIVGLWLVPWLYAVGIGTRYPLPTAFACTAIANLLLICGTFIQLIFAAKVRNPSLWAFGGLASVLILLPILLSLVGESMPAIRMIWTLIGYAPWAFPGADRMLEVIFGILGQWLLLAFLLWKFQRTLQQLRVGSQTASV
ncbi:MAG: hypothetical protein KME35_24385 [Aphanocapsa sp. GSE-SYN-MK-11-07L]|jgi:hypothetical protein|nr:hypothetical protein [Aphanocapsa sp. GSE-SYN-MK-11-07L]